MEFLDIGPTVEDRTDTLYRHRNPATSSRDLGFDDLRLTTPEGFGPFTPALLDANLAPRGADTAQVQC